MLWQLNTAKCVQLLRLLVCLYICRRKGWSNGLEKYLSNLKLSPFILSSTMRVPQLVIWLFLEICVLSAVVRSSALTRNGNIVVHTLNPRAQAMMGAHKISDRPVDPDQANDERPKNETKRIRMPTASPTPRVLLPHKLKKTMLKRKTPTPTPLPKKTVPPNETSLGKVGAETEAFHAKCVPCCSDFDYGKCKIFKRLVWLYSKQNRRRICRVGTPLGKKQKPRWCFGYLCNRTLLVWLFKGYSC